ncbi:hypothetical protein IWW57_003742 [Coemansia sp. S610]|nr:hypothetical protein IWW57_003742 [Coemansia sp. S610]KAJ2356178.1 hypothetical protein H4S02_012787 [Coemansia sp. RSA 2611]
MPTDNKSTPTTSDAIGQPAKDTATAEHNESRITPPTWSEVMQSRIKAKPRGRNMSQDNKLVNPRVCVSKEFHASVSGKAPGDALPVTAKLSCFEILSPVAVNAVLLERRQQNKGQRGGWADAWYARWLVQIQFFTILDQKHIKRAQELMKSSGLPTRDIAREVIADDEERKAKFQFVTMDESMVEWPASVAGFYRRMFAPNVTMGRKYVESWQNGNQLSMLTKFWDSAVNFGGIKLAAKALSNMAKAWDEENGSDKKQD